ncbi:nitrite reductase large subunit NirB [Nocardioides sp. DS6]|uniref:assimilatory sulfite reductase (ferredoxin) n=1 Tax=Nocardioides eburneus TaxID=3231482 RepID=A0ABV3STV2_9ACTN
MNTRKTLVVVGHGMVGHRFVQAAIERGLTETHDIVVIGEESRPAYDRVALTSFFEVGAEALSFLPAGRYDDPRVSLRLGTAVVAISPRQRVVTLSDGEELPYDELVLAAGAAPFVPPVPGHDLPGAFVYRTIDDLEAIRKAAKKAKAGAVIGGGLLGLEAANALHQLGVETHVVEMNPRLMSVQVDEAGGRTLNRHICDLGLTIHTGAMTEAVLGTSGPNRKVTGLALKDRLALDVDLVIFSAGIRPRDGLARTAGLEVAERGGVLVDEQCRSSDEHIWAIGECAAPGGRMYGLVAPGYAMAEVVVDAMLGGAGAFTGADMSTKLKLLGVDVASFGDAHGTTEGSLELVYADDVAGIYKKLVISEDGTRLLGGVLVGDASSYGMLRPMVATPTSPGIPLPANPEELILPAGSGGGAAVALPAEAQVCSCNNVTKGQIEAAVDAGCETAADVTRETKAGSTCGSCKPQVKKIVEDYFAAQGKVVDKSLCEHFRLTRAELFDVVLIHGYRSFDEIIEAHGTGRGCDICKPAIASILASQLNQHVLEQGNRQLQDTNDAYLANLQKNGTYSVVPRVPGGEITPEKLIVLGEVARDFGLYTKITGGQRIDLFGARMEQLPEIWRRLVDAGFESGHAYGKALRTVKSCVGSTWCRYGVQDSVGLAIDLELRYRGLRSPHKLKGGVSGCARECAEARGKDFGVIATEKGWNLYVGGNGGAIPAHAQLLAGDLDTETLVRYLDRFLMYYIRTADRLQRTSTWIESLDGGLDRVREVVVDDVLGLGSELEAAMTHHIDGYFDEWKATLDDPDKLRRFVSFVNAPETPDPNISFGVNRGQIVPELHDEPQAQEPVLLGASIPVGGPR